MKYKGKSVDTIKTPFGVFELVSANVVLAENIVMYDLKYYIKNTSSTFDVSVDEFDIVFEGEE